MGRLKRIAALTASALIAVMGVGAMDVGALVGVTTPTVTVTVPQTPVTPTTTVTTPPPPPAPTVTTPAPAPVPKVDLPKVNLPTPSGGGSSSGSGSGSGSSGSGTLDPVKKTLDSFTGGSSSGGGSGSGSGSGGGSGSGSSGVSGTVDTVSGTVDKVVSGVSGGRTVSGISAGGTSSGGGTTGSNTAALQALGFFGDPPGSGSGGGGTGPGGQGGSGSGGNIFTSAGAGGRGGGGLPPVLSVAGAKQLRAALELLEGCMSAIAPLDRQVLLMRAGSGGAAPLSRRQVAARLGVSPRQVRFAERRGLTGLRTAASETACAGGPGNPFSVIGIAISPLVALTAAPATVPAVAQAAGDGDGVFVPARQAQPDGESPLAALADGGESGPAWIVVLVTVLFSVAIAGLMRELRSALGHQRPY